MGSGGTPSLSIDWVPVELCSLYLEEKLFPELFF